MMKMNQWLATAGVAAAMCLGMSQGLVQQDSNRENSGGGQGGGGRGDRFGGGNFDPAQMQQMMMERLRDDLEVKEDAEWKALEPLIQKVMDTRRQVEGDRMRGMFGRRGRGGGGGDNSGDQ